MSTGESFDAMPEDKLPLPPGIMDGEFSSPESSLEESLPTWLTADEPPSFLNPTITHTSIDEDPASSELKFPEETGNAEDLLQYACSEHSETPSTESLDLPKFESVREDISQQEQDFASPPPALNSNRSTPSTQETPDSDALSLAQTPTLAQTPPPVESKSRRIAPALVESTSKLLELAWLNRAIKITPVLEENGKMIVFRVTVRADLGRGYRDCRVTFPLPSGLKQVHASRKPIAKRGRLIWELGEIRPGDAVPLSVKIPIELTTRELADVPRSFDIAYIPEETAILKCEIAGPPVIPIDEPFSLLVRVLNQGDRVSGTVNLRVASRTIIGKSTDVVLDAISPGEALETNVQLIAPRSGAHEWRVTAFAGGSEPTETLFATRAVAPQVNLALEHESVVRLDAESDVAIALHNDSPVPTRDVRVQFQIPEELAFVSSPDGLFDPSTSIVEWQTLDLDPGATSRRTVRLRGFAPGLVRMSASITARHEVTSSTVSNLFCEIGNREASSTLDRLLTALDEPSYQEQDIATSTKGSIGQRYLLFKMALGQYAVPIENIREVARPPQVAHVPNLMEWIQGVANIRGDIISIVDLPLFLGLDGSPLYRALLVSQTSSKDLAVGLLVDEVIGIRRLQANAFSKSASNVEKAMSEFIESISEYEGKLVPILDFDRMLQSEALQAYECV